MSPLEDLPDMTQQPLSRVRPNPQVKSGPQDFEMRPELTSLLGRVIGTWAEVEASMIGILTAIGRQRSSVKPFAPRASIPNIRATPEITVAGRPQRMGVG